MPPPVPPNRRALVTGASSGLGRALAEHLARDGARVVLAGRSAARLDAVVAGLTAEGVPPGSLRAVPGDLTVADDRRRLLDAASETFGGALDLLVNAAGVGAYGRFESHPPEILRAIFEINVFALAELSRGALPMLRRGRRPAVVNLGSIVARRALPGRPEYSASKFAVAALSESLRAEWAVDGIHLLLVNPGFTATAFESNLLIDTTVYSTSRRRTMTADAVAAATLRALARRRNELTLSLEGRLLLAVNRVLPRLVDLGFDLWTRRLFTRFPVAPPALPLARPHPRMNAPRTKAHAGD